MRGEDDAVGLLYGPLGVLACAVIMGLCGGLSFGNTYWEVNNGVLPRGVWYALEKAQRGAGGYVRVRSGEEEEDNGRAREGRGREAEREMAMREFLLSTIAPPDTCAILMASLVGMKVQPALCAVQVKGGRGLCKKTR